MAQYETIWRDYHLPTGQEFNVAVCGYNGKIRHMTLGSDPLRRMFVQKVTVDGQTCNCAHHCLALDCPLNHTEHEHLMHMLDMYRDEPVDEATAKLWGKKTAVDCFVEMARQISESLAREVTSEKSDNILYS
jgi:hypothetical protein